MKLHEATWCSKLSYKAHTRTNCAASRCLAQKNLAVHVLQLTSQLETMATHVKWNCTPFPHPFCNVFPHNWQLVATWSPPACDKQDRRYTLETGLPGVESHHEKSPGKIATAEIWMHDVPPVNNAVDIIACLLIFCYFFATHSSIFSSSKIAVAQYSVLPHVEFHICDSGCSAETLSCGSILDNNLSWRNMLGGGFNQCVHSHTWLLSIFLENHYFLTIFRKRPLFFLRVFPVSLGCSAGRVHKAERGHQIEDLATRCDKHLPSWELTYPLPRQFWKWFSLS